MSYLEITGVVPALRVSLGEYTIHSGHVALARSTAFRGAVRAEAQQPVAVFVPDAAPFTTPPAGIGLEVGLRRIQTMPNPGMVYFGPSEAAAEVVPDPRGGEHRWLQVAFRLPIYSHAAVEINYRVTVHVPA